LVSFHHTVKPPIQFQRRPAARDLLLVRLAFWIGIVTAISLVVWVIWALATHEPSQFPLAGD